MERETAMKILKELHDNSLFSNRIALETLIPELADSNDERIRKALLEMVHDTTGDELWVDYDVHKEEAFAWLEKQGESYTKKDVDDAYLKGICDAKHELEKQGEQNPVGKPKLKFKVGDVLCDKSCTTLDRNSQPNIEILDIRDGMYICNNCSFPISQQDEYELVTKKNEPQYAWSDEDEKMYKIALSCIETLEDISNGKNMHADVKDWLKSIKNRIGG